MRRGPHTPIFRPEKQRGQIRTGTAIGEPPPPPLTVTINQGSGQTDPTTASPVLFDVVFSEPVTGFTTGDVTLSGTTGTLVGTVSGSGATYTVSVAGMTSSGTLTATIAAGVATSVAYGMPNQASTSSDNTVFFCFPTLSVFGTYDSDYFNGVNRGVYGDGYMYVQAQYRPSGQGVLTVVDVSVPEVVATVTHAAIWNVWNAVLKVGDYVYIGTGVITGQSRFGVVDVSDPLNPTVVADYVDAFFNSNFTSLAAFDNYVIGVIATDRFAVIDVTDPTDPVIVATVTDSTNIPGGSSGSVVVGDYVYIAVDLFNTSWVAIYDISNPLSPTWVVNLADAAIHANEMLVDGDVVWHDIASHGFGSIDVVDPSDPYSVGWATIDDHAAAGARFAKSGNYGVVASNNRVSVVDMTNRPRRMGFLSTITHANLSSVNEVEFDGTWAYCSGGSRFTTVNLTTPGSPAMGATTTTNLSTTGRIHKVGNFVYVPNSGNDRLVIFNVTSPGAFSQAGTVTNATTLNLINAAFKSGNHCYLTSSEAGGRFAVVDVTTPATPTVAASVTGANYGPASMVTVDGTHAYIGRNDGHIAVVDISTPASPSFVTSLDIDLTAASMFVDGTTLYVAGGSGDQVVSIDISTPASPTLLDSFQCLDASDLVVDGDYLYVRGVYSECAIRAVDVTDPTDMLSIGHIGATGTSGGFSFPKLAKDGDIVYAGNGFGRAVIAVDVTDPDRPVISNQTGLTDDATLDSSAGGIGVDANGVYVVSDGQHGLFVYDLSLNLDAHIGDTTSRVETSRLVGDVLYTQAGASLGAIDVSDPENPVDLFSVYTQSLDGEGVAGMCIHDDHAYFQTSDGELIVMDITTDPPAFVVNTGPLTELASGSNGSIVGDGNYLYHRKGSRFTVIDVTTPATPTVVGSILDATNLDGTDTCNCVVVDGSYAYTVAASVDRVLVIDISTPATPTIVGNVQNATTLDGARSIIKDGNLVYVGCASRVTVVNVTTPATPTISGSVSSSQLGTVSGLVKSGNYVYCSNLSTSVDRVTVVNVTNPASPSIRSSVLDATILDQGASIDLVDGMLLVPAGGGSSFGWLALVDGACT